MEWLFTICSREIACLPSLGLQATIADILRNRMWNWPRTTDTQVEEITAHAGTQVTLSTTDKPRWKGNPHFSIRCAYEDLWQRKSCVSWHHAIGFKGTYLGPHLCLAGNHGQAPYEAKGIYLVSDSKFTMQLLWVNGRVRISSLFLLLNRWAIWGRLLRKLRLFGLRGDWDEEFRIVLSWKVCSLDSILYKLRSICMWFGMKEIYLHFRIKEQVRII